LDGVRSYWDGNKLFSKGGNEIFAPKWFTDQLPKGIALDGELWGGKGNFEYTCTTVIRKRPQNDPVWENTWKDISYHIFDAPDSEGGFEKRMDFAKKVVEERKATSPILSVIKMEQCKGPDHLKKYLAEVQRRGGEGVMLRESNCPYKHGRSKTLLKVKPHREDEVKYVGRNFEGKSLICEAYVSPCLPED